ncbi:S24 family peptidase [Novosphingobium sp. KN65.2]|uniref:S24 family peptidase n=1 Tax=Novosphingobium sp. KN65.2 TaxID=1478134 RepID=UPI0005DD9B09|nr:S24 family peptidase [Novosphingobium sp. KN65.2]CDO35022.1 hypothetical protein SPHV1_2180034 [Novosphingobium sp. KN65.2]
MASSITKSVIDPCQRLPHQADVLTKSELLKRVDEAAKSRAEIARVLNVAPARITEMFKGDRDLSFDEARKLIDHFQIADGETSLITPTPPSLEDLAAEHGIALIEEVDVAFGLGGTYLEGEPEVLGLVPFKADWLHDLFRGSLTHLKVVRGKGDSMQPTIMDGDIVLIDTAHRRIDEQDRIWAVAYGDIGMVKRVRITSRSSVMLMSDNQVVSPIEAVDDEMQVLGRVIWIGRRI